MMIYDNEYAAEEFKESIDPYGESPFALLRKGTQKKGIQEE